MRWSEAYECGDAPIDAEHRELFEQANRLLGGLVDPGVSRPQLIETYEALVESIVTHFRHEEARREASGYAALAEHRCVHASLLRRPRRLHEDFRATDCGIGTMIEFVVRDVVVGHLLHVDRHYYPCVAAHACAAGPRSVDGACEG